jgi:hypothetical protein
MLAGPLTGESGGDVFEGADPVVIEGGHYVWAEADFTRFRRVENQAIEAWRAVHDLVCEGPDLAHQREIAGRHLEIGVRYTVSDSVSRLLASLGGTRTYQHSRSAFGELGRNRLANAARRACHEKGGRCRRNLPLWVTPSQNPTSPKVRPHHHRPQRGPRTLTISEIRWKPHSR